MTEQPKNDPHIITCLRCGGAMFEARTSIHPTYYNLSLVPVDKGMFDGRQSYVVPLVCRRCGYTELRATDPEQLLPKSSNKQVDFPLTNDYHGEEDK